MHDTIRAQISALLFKLPPPPPHSPEKASPPGWSARAWASAKIQERHPVKLPRRGALPAEPRVYTRPIARKAREIWANAEFCIYTYRAARLPSSARKLADLRRARAPLRRCCLRVLLFSRTPRFFQRLILELGNKLVLYLPRFDPDSGSFTVIVIDRYSFDTMNGYYGVFFSTVI